jgi:hypothetical protein
MKRDRTLKSCFLIGPPSGAIVILLLLWITNKDWPGIGGGTSGGILGTAMILGLPASYIGGGGQAVLCSLFLSHAGKRFGYLPIWIPAVGGIFTAMLSYFFIYFNGSPSALQDFVEGGVFFAILLANMVASYVCWLKYRSLWDSRLHDSPHP